MSWKFVFNSNMAPFGTYRDLHHCAEVAEEVGYPFFTFNDGVYHTTSKERVMHPDDLF